MEDLCVFQFHIFVFVGHNISQDKVSYLNPMKPVVIYNARWIIVSLFLAIIMNFYFYQDSFGQFRIPNNEDSVQASPPGIETSSSTQSLQDEGLVNTQNITQQETSPQSNLLQQEQEMALTETTN